MAVCPMAKKVSGSRLQTATGSATTDGVSRSYSIAYTYGSTFGAWEITSPSPAFHGSYGCNGWLFRGFTTLLVPPASAQYLDFLSLRERNRIPLMSDCAYPYSTPTVPTAKPNPITGEVPTITLTPFLPTDRHNGSVNCVFLDWSVRKIGPQEMWRLKWASDFKLPNP
jgi:prepilin-type processing-associated H-X9-DG protein